MAPDHSTSDKMCEYEGATNRTDHSSVPKLKDNDIKKCYIRIVLPTLSNDGMAEAQKEPEKMLKTEPSPTPRSESVSPTPHPNTPNPEERTIPDAEDSGDTRKDQEEKYDQQHHHQIKCLFDKNDLAKNNQKNRERHIIPIRTSRTPKKPLLLERPKNCNFAGSFVDIGGWQDELKKVKSNIVEDILKKRSKTFPSLHGKSQCKASKFKFEHHEDLTRYIRDYRYTQTAGIVGRRRLWDGSYQNLHNVSGSQRSLGVPGFRVKTTDPGARTFLPHTPTIASDINLHGGCIMCEQEKFRLRNSFPKRVFLSWSQYMTLCKSNTFMMSQMNTAAPLQHEPLTPYSSPRSVSAYSPTRPLRLLNQREKTSDMDFKYKNLSERKPRQIVQKRSPLEQNSVDKTLIVYRLSEKMRQSTSLSKLDQIGASSN